VTAEIMERWAPILVGVDLLTGSKGVFDVVVDDQTVFTKAQARRRPRPGEIPALLEPILGPPLTWR
jgi:hypothetical protein